MLTYISIPYVLLLILKKGSHSVNKLLVEKLEFLLREVVESELVKPNSLKLAKLNLLNEQTCQTNELAEQMNSSALT